MSLYQLAVDNGRPCAVTCHAWNADRTLLAYCPNNNQIHIAEFADGKLETKTVLSEHDEVVTALSWGHQHNRFVSVSQDRNAFVWTWAANHWEPKLVMLRINRAATSVQWSPSENKFAVGTGQGLVCICFFEEEQDWWVSKHIELPVAPTTVKSIAWNPSGTLLATGSTDGKCRIYSAAVKDVDKKPPKMFGEEKPAKLGTLFFEVDCDAWVHAVAFSPSGSHLAFSSHNSTLHLLSLPSDRLPQASDVKSLQTNSLAVTRLLWLSGSSLVGGGHGTVPTLFHVKGDTLVAGRGLDDPSKRSDDKRRGSVVSESFKKFEARTAKGEDGASSKLETLHQNQISGFDIVSGTAANVSSFSSVGLDGRLVIWDLKSLEAQLGALSLQ